VGENSAIMLSNGKKEALSIEILFVGYKFELENFLHNPPAKKVSVKFFPLHLSWDFGLM
jgi:hypothetical protein